METEKDRGEKKEKNLGTSRRNLKLLYTLTRKKRKGIFLGSSSSLLSKVKDTCLHWIGKFMLAS